MGLVDAHRRYLFSTVTPAIWDTGLSSGNVSLIAQSGMLAGAFLIDLMSHGTMGIAKVCSIGNKMDVDENDLLEWLIHDPDTAAIGLYLESLTDCRRFMALCRSTPKPVVILTGGKLLAVRQQLRVTPLACLQAGPWLPVLWLRPVL